MMIIICLNSISIIINNLSNKCKKIMAMNKLYIYVVLILISGFFNEMLANDSITKGLYFTPKIEISPTEIEVSYLRNTFTIDVECSVPGQGWSCTADVSWIELEFNGINSSTFVCGDNNIGLSRTGRVTFTPLSGGISATLTVVQAGKPYLNISTDNLSLDDQASTFTISVSSNYDWSFSESASWITHSSTSGENIVFSVDSYATTGTRSASIVFTNTEGVSKTLTVSQTSTPTISIAPGSVSLPEEGGEFTVNVNSNRSWTYTNTSNWISEISKSSSQIVLSASANTSTTSSRTGTLTFHAEKASTDFIVNQKKALYWEIEPESIELPYTGGDFSIKIRTSTLNWSIKALSGILQGETEYDLPDIIQNFTAPPNTTYSPISNKIVFKADGVDKYLPFTILPAPYVNMSIQEYTFDYSGGFFDLEVSSNYNIVISEDVDWLSIEQLSSNQYRISSDINISDEQRSCMISCKAVNSNSASLLTKNIEIIQEEGFSPDGNMNYVYEVSFREPVSDIEEVKELNLQIDYFDGLGRKIQSNQVHGSPGHNDIILPVQYDENGRINKNYLPYISNKGGRFDDKSISNQTLYYNNLFPDEMTEFESNDVSGAFSEIKFEKSPLNRELEIGQAGKTWRITELSDIYEHSNGKTVKYSYNTNTDAISTYYAKKTIDNVTKSKFNYSLESIVYEPGDLLGKTIIDENGSITQEYSDNRGKVVLKVSNNQLQTFYIYDENALLYCVIPPKAEGDPTKTELCYYYKYDGRSRMIEKKLPGAEAVYIVYDNRDRLVATQDGNMRNASGGPQWLFTKYDIFNRPVMTGIISIDGEQLEVQTLVNNFYNSSATKLYESIGSAVHGYTNVSWPNVSTANDYLSVTYYDDYQNLPASDFSQEYYGIKTSTVLRDANSDNVPDEYYENIKGLVAGTKTKVLDGKNTWAHSVSYYDKKYRIIQSISDIYQDGISGQEVMSTAYNFVGQPIKAEYVHEGTETVTITKRYDYDHTGRLLKVYHKINDNPEVLMSSLKYNELGEVVEKNLHSSDINATEQTAFWQSVDYRYNIRGWLKNINNTALSNNPSEGNDDVNDLFGFEIKYNDPF